MLINWLIQTTGLVSEVAWFAVYVLWVLGSSLFLLLHRRRPVTTLAWLLTFWTLPVVSLVGYWLFGPRRLNDQRSLRQVARHHALAARPQVDAAASETFRAATPFHSLARVTRASGEPSATPTRADSLQLYRDGDEVYPEIIKAIQAATATLHLEYYIWQPDIIGTRCRDELIERARQGIDVRIVVDALGAKNCSNEFWQPLISAGGDVRKFNPPRLFKPQPGKINFRTHRKIVIVDGWLGFTGGVNIDDHNWRLDDAPDAWRSTHLKLTGQPVSALQKVFLEDWIYAVSLREAEPSTSDIQSLLSQAATDSELPADIDRWFPPLDAGEGPWVQIVESGPDEPTNDIQRLFFAAIVRARHRLWICTPYFVPDEAIETALRDAASRGVDVKLLVPEQGDSRMVQAASQTYFDELQQEGAEVWQYRPRMIHSKTVLVDDGFCIVGTANMDNRSFRLNFEVVVAIFDATVAGTLAHQFEVDLMDACRYRETSDERRWTRKVYLNFMRLLSPLL